jgi:hypothetical protein
MDSSNTKPDVPVTMDSFSTLDQGWETDSTYSADGQLKALGYAPELKRVHTFWTSESLSMPYREQEDD